MECNRSRKSKLFNRFLFPRVAPLIGLFLFFFFLLNLEKRIGNKDVAYYLALRTIDPLRAFVPIEPIRYLLQIVRRGTSVGTKRTNEPGRFKIQLELDGGQRRLLGQERPGREHGVPRPLQAFPKFAYNPRTRPEDRQRS